jgi:hypothetical protein
MKQKILLLTLLMTCSLSLFSQNLAMLDKVNGFKKFKFGMNKNEFSNLKETQTNIIMNDVKNYDYTGSDIKNFYGVPIDQINLSFYKNKLYQIRISFGTIYEEYTISQFNLVKQNLITNFGTNYRSIEKNTESDIIDAYGWRGQNVKLDTYRLNLSEKDGSRNPRYNYIQGFILFTDKKIELLQQRSEIE